MGDIIKFKPREIPARIMDLPGTLATVGEVLKENNIKGDRMEIHVYDKAGNKVITVNASLPEETT